MCRKTMLGMKLQKSPSYLKQRDCDWRFLRASGIRFLRVLGNSRISDMLKNRARFLTKGQLLSMDAVASVVLFIITIVFIFSLWNLYTIRLSESIASEEMQLVAFQVTDILVKSQGVPNVWENDPDAVEVIGLQLHPGVLDNNKLAAFLAMDYDATKKVFNIERFEYNFTVLDRYGDVLNSTGMPLSATAAQRVAVHRIVLINNQTRNVQFTVWREK